MLKYRVFTINPGSTSTKAALFAGEERIFSINVEHDAEVLKKFPDFSDQLDYRMETILGALEEKGISLQGTDAFVGRGGGLFSMEGGVYALDPLILDHSIHGANGIRHPAQLGPTLAQRMIERFGGQGFVVNPPDVDEYAEVARITGIQGIYRTSHIHALNQKETAIRHAKAIGKRYEDCNLIVAHIGGGISVAAHQKGRMIDSNDNVGGEGPMTPTRCGAIPADPMIRLCCSGRYSEKELLAKCQKTGGFMDLLGTSDAQAVDERAANGDRMAQLCWDAMIYQIEKYIGSMAAVLHGKVDGILLGGGIVHSKDLVDKISEACGWIAPVTAYPGEFEMEAMAAGAIRALTGEEAVRHYTGVPAWNGIER